jgi:hypothetical protein
MRDKHDMEGTEKDGQAGNGDMIPASLKAVGRRFTVSDPTSQNHKTLSEKHRDKNGSGHGSNGRARA